MIRLRYLRFESIPAGQAAVVVRRNCNICAIFNHTAGNVSCLYHNALCYAAPVCLSLPMLQGSWLLLLLDGLVRH